MVRRCNSNSENSNSHNGWRGQTAINKGQRLPPGHAWVPTVNAALLDCWIVGLLDCPMARWSAEGVGSRCRTSSQPTPNSPSPSPLSQSLAHSCGPRWRCFMLQIESWTSNRLKKNKTNTAEKKNKSRRGGSAMGSGSRKVGKRRLADKCRQLRLRSRSSRSSIRWGCWRSCVRSPERWEREGAKLKRGKRSLNPLWPMIVWLADLLLESTFYVNYVLPLNI